MPLLGGRPMTAPTGCFGFSTKTNGEHGSPLQYNNNKNRRTDFSLYGGLIYSPYSVRGNHIHFCHTIFCIQKFYPCK